MKIISSSDKVTVIIPNTFDTDINSLLEKLIKRIKKTYNYDLKGFYKADVYLNDRFGMIINFEKEDLDLFDDLIDLDINIIRDAEVWLCFDDYFFCEKEDIYFYDRKFYIDLDNAENLVNLLEFSEVVYGSNLVNLKKNLKLFCKKRKKIVK